MIAFHSKEWDRVAEALMAMPRPQWDVICSECFPDLPAYAIGPALVIAIINSFDVKITNDKGKTIYYINESHSITVYHRSE